MANNVVILRKVKSVYSGHIFSVQAGEALQNGAIGVLGANVAGEMEIRTLGKVEATKKVVLVAEPELIYDNNRSIDDRLDNFSIPAGKIARAYSLEADDEYAISAQAITGTKAKYVIGKASSFGYSYSATIPADASFVAEVIAETKLGTGIFGTFNGTVKGGVVDLVELRVISNK